MTWEKKWSNTRNRPYYFNSETGESQWEISPSFTEKELEKSLPVTESIRVYHFLVKHENSRRPSSWRQTEIKITEQEALGLINNYKMEILKSKNVFEKFKELSMNYSDCNSAKRGGDLGFFKRGQMTKEFEDASFNAEIGKIIGPISTESGYHLIFRTD